MTNRKPKKFIETADLLRFARRRKNVLFTGLHGIGKTSIIKDVFNAHFGVEGKDWVYFNAATIDPYINLLGIPQTVMGSEGHEVTRCVPPEQLSSSVRAIYVDEFNRGSKETRNGFMELLQNKSVNGRRFERLEVVWTSVNPATNGDYDVDQIDPAQEDRFHAHVHLPYAVNEEYFAKKFGDDMWHIPVEWWDKLSNDHKLLCSPRRLDEAVDAILDGDNVSYYLSDSINSTTLVKNILAAQSSTGKHSMIDAMSPEEIRSYFTTEKVLDLVDYFKKYQHVFKKQVMRHLSTETIEGLAQQAAKAKGLVDILIRAGLYKPVPQDFSIVQDKTGGIPALISSICNGPTKGTKIGMKNGSSIPAMESIFKIYEPIYNYASAKAPMQDTVEQGRTSRMQSAMHSWNALTLGLDDVYSKLIFVLSYARHEKPGNTHMFTILNLLGNYATHDFKSFLRDTEDDPNGLKFMGELVTIGMSIVAIKSSIQHMGGGMVGYFNNKIFQALKVVIAKLIRSKDIRPLLEANFGEGVIEKVANEILYSKPKNSIPINAADSMMKAYVKVFE